MDSRNPAVGQRRQQNTETFAVYTIVERGEGKKPFWNRVGSAWKNKDDSFRIFLDALPVNGTLHLCKQKERDERERAAPPDDNWQPPPQHDDRDDDIPFGAPR